MDGTPLSLPTHYPKRKIHFRNLKNINPDALTLDLKQLSASTADSHSVTEAVDTYNHSLRSLLDLHAPLKSRTVSFSHSAPWYTCELRTMKAAGRALEWRLKVSGLTTRKPIENTKRLIENTKMACSATYSLVRSVGSRGVAAS